MDHLILDKADRCGCACGQGTADAAGTDWKAAACEYIQIQIREGITMTVLRMCEISQVSRASFYRFAPEADHVDLDLDLRNEIQHIALEFRFYGRPRITAELRRRGWTVNHKRVGRILREAGSPLGAALPASAEICGGNDER